MVGGQEKVHIFFANVTLVSDDDKIRMKVGMKDGMKGILGRWLVFRLNSLFFRNKKP